ncbi:MAG: LuxR C-terminal-related transcriptional regulator [Rhodospirillaceae bacterium]|nr:LuxR C-terminal-related transcriptional regulator [Rhodospirillaceae bacterium]
MSRDGPAGKSCEAPQETGGAPSAAKAFPWLLHHKITIPDRVRGYVHRAELVDRAMPTRRPLTVLKASGGFGKTTLLAECCRQLRQDGVATAWVSLDGHDTAAVLDIYIAVACHIAGLEFHNDAYAVEAAGGPEGRIGTIVRKIQSLGKPFVIAFDELERLVHPAAVSMLAFLLQRAPSNLHLAFACRQVPDGLNVAGALLEGRGEALATEDLRFSREEVARFFDLRLSRRALADEMNRSAGWPVALRISRNSLKRGTEGSGGFGQDFIGNWIESRLFEDLEPDDRNLVLDLGLFGFFDAHLLADALQQSDSMRHVTSMAALDGLLERVRSDRSETWRLHPLVREHCARQRFREDPQRFAAIHRRIALALGRRGETVPAMRHAAEGGDTGLAGEILEQAGGVRLWIFQGVPQFQEANRLLNRELITTRPRLRLVRCVALTLAGRQHEARALYLSHPRPAFPTDDEDPDLQCYVEDCIVRGAMGLYGGESVGSDHMRTLAGDMARLVLSPRLDPFTRGYLEYARCILHSLIGEFESALQRLSAARDLFGGTHYLAFYGELLHGQIEFEKGRAPEAESHFRRARRIARKRFPLDPVAAASCELMLTEVALECNRISSASALPGLRKALTTHGVPFSFFAAATNVLLGMRLRAGRVGTALADADELLAHLRGAGLTNFARLLAALRVSLLVIAGRVGDAERAWRAEALPENPLECANLKTQTWREMEAVSEARARILIAGGRYDEARRLLHEMHAVAVGRSMRRIRMHALVFSIALEQRAGESAAGKRHLTEYLELFAESPYAWPLLKERATCAETVSRFLESDPDSPHRSSAHSLLAAMHPLEDASNLLLSERELEVLQELAGQRVKQIAASLGLSVHGVRYHLRKLFTKLDVSNRADLLRRARELSLIQDDP